MQQVNKRGRAMSEVQANGIRIYYEEHGQGAAILLIHGSGSDATFWGEGCSSSAGA